MKPTVEETSFSLDAICEMAATMSETYKKMKRIPKHMYGQYYLREKAKYDARHVTMRYERWKSQEWDETFESLKDKQTQVVAEFLTKRPLRFSRRPTQREVSAVQLDLVTNRLAVDFMYCEDFKEMCACFRRFNSWEGDVLKLNYDYYGKYFLHHFYKMTEEECQAFFDMDITVELINKDIIKVMPKPEPPTPTPPTLPEELRTKKAMALWRKLQEAGLVDEHYQPTISRTLSAILADKMAVKLGIKEKWKVFEALWNRKGMYNDHYKAMDQEHTLPFLDTLKRLFR